MNRRAIIIGIVCCAFAATLYAEDSVPVIEVQDEPIIEVKADRTMVYPQRMALTGEETLLDMLQMMPDLMISGYEDLISSYNLRIDNVPINGDVRLVLNQMKAKDIAKLQVCTNTGVAKGTIGRGGVLDITMAMPDTVSGMAEGQGGFGNLFEGSGTVNVLYGSTHTDVYANASYRYLDEHREYVTLHMTNRFDARNKLLTYFTQQYVGTPDASAQKIMGRARYFHTFNDAGTELMVLGGYQYATDPIATSQLPMFVLELNTPLPLKGLTMMAGVEGDYSMNKQKTEDRSWDIFNHDLYLQFTYSPPKWRFTAGHRVMLYNYHMVDSGLVRNYLDVRNNTNACVIYVPGSRHQIQLGYYRKYYNPALDWDDPIRLQDEQDINQLKLAYAYSTQKVTVQPEASFYIVEDEEMYGEIGASAYWKTKWVTLTGGANLYVAKSKVYATLRVAPTVHLPRHWQVGLQLVYFTRQSPIREAYGTPIYGCVSINRQVVNYLNVGVEWHDMFDSFCSGTTMNRHAATVKVQCRF